MDRIKVYLIDSYPAMRQAISALLEKEPHIQVLGGAGDQAEVLKQVAALNPDVVVTETRGPSFDGFKLAQELKRDYPKVYILFFTQDESPFYFFQALRTGCDGYIPKSAHPREFISGIESVAKGQRYVHPSLARWLVREFVSRSKGLEFPENHQQLSPRELEILELISMGLTNWEIAERLKLSINTIRHHRTRLMNKLGAKTAGGLVRQAALAGLLQTP